MAVEEGKAISERKEKEKQPSKGAGRTVSVREAPETLSLLFYPARHDLALWQRSS